MSHVEDNINHFLTQIDSILQENYEVYAFSLYSLTYLVGNIIKMIKSPHAHYVRTFTGTFPRRLITYTGFHYIVFITGIRLVYNLLLLLLLLLVVVVVVVVVVVLLLLLVVLPKLSIFVCSYVKKQTLILTCLYRTIFYIFTL